MRRRKKTFRAQWAKREGLAYRDPFPKVPKREMEQLYQRDLVAFAKDKKAGDAEKLLFRSEWAISKGIELKTPFAAINKHEPERTFQETWIRHREIYLSNLITPDLYDRNLRKAILQRAFLFGVKLEKAILTGANLVAARLEGANFANARLEGANLKWAKLERSYLYRAKLDGADLKWARLFGFEGKLLDLRYTSLRAAIFAGSALRLVDLSATNLTKLRNFENSFGDGSVRVPEGFKRPCQWGKVVLSDEAYFGRWRWWLEVRGFVLFIPFDLRKYKAIPPDDKDCKWKSGK